MKINKDFLKRNLNVVGIKKLFRLIFKPIISRIETNKIRKNALKLRQHYDDVINSIKKSGKTKLDFAAYVIFDSTYGFDGAFKLMLNNRDRWNPYIVVIPDIMRSPEHAKEQYILTKKYFIQKYGKDRVLDGWDYEKDVFYDYVNRFDIIYYANPYDKMAHKYHKISYACTKNVLPIYISYGYDIGKKTTISRLVGPELNYVWKLFADTTYTYDDYKKYQIIHGENVILAGYSKMDSYRANCVEDKKRTKILISSHHTVSMKELPLSNFLKYSDLYLKLPKLFPQIDFVFRPHPLLFTTLIDKKNWTKTQVDEYLRKLNENNIEYSVGGGYLDLFSECDAIINDCGSFTIEWLYTGKKGCFVYNKKLKDNFLTTLMNKALEKYTIAKCEQDIINFVSNVDKDDSVTGIDEWVRDNIMLNYPNVSKFILNEIDVLK